MHRLSWSIHGPLLAVTRSCGLSAAGAEDLSGYDGAQLYKRFCASCHGASCVGDGPVAGTFRLRVPDLTALAARRGGQFPEERLRQIIDGRSGPASHGTREMPVWGLEFKAAGADADAAVGKLVAQLRSLQQPAR